MKCDILLITQTLRSYAAEIPGGKIDKRKVNSLKDSDHLLFIYYDRCTHVYFSHKTFDVSSMKDKMGYSV